MDYWYISRDIELQSANIIKYTSEKARLIRYEGRFRTELNIQNGQLLSIERIPDNNIQVHTKKISDDATYRFIRNVAETLLEEQDTAMRSPVNEVTFIIGPA